MLGTSSASAQDKPVSFINDVAPILKENCFACHDAKKRSGKYDMTTFEKLMAGGAGGEGITPGKHAESEMFDADHVRERAADAAPEGQPVPVPEGQDRGRSRSWIEQGAKLDAGIDPKADLVKELRVRWKAPPPPAKYPYPTIVNALAFTPDGKQLVVGGHHELTVWDVATAKLHEAGLHPGRAGLRDGLPAGRQAGRRRRPAGAGGRRPHLRPDRDRQDRDGDVRSSTA